MNEDQRDSSQKKRMVVVYIGKTKTKARFIPSSDRPNGQNSNAISLRLLELTFHVRFSETQMA
jgi:hypothetical protein